MSNGDIFAGAVTGAFLCYLTYFAQFRANAHGTGATEGTAGEPVATLGVFSTIPEIRNPVANLVTEIIATVALVLPILAFGLTEGLGESGTLVLIVSLLVVGIGLSLGGPTGYAINPARDLGPRLVHTFLPIPNKGTSDWGYAWIPVAGPLIGGALAGVVYNAAF
jgi:glycerol uptake facilitator protein